MWFSPLLMTAKRPMVGVGVTVGAAVAVAVDAGVGGNVEMRRSLESRLVPGWVWEC